MLNYSAVKISGSETYRLADMEGVLRDLSWTVDLCDQILRRMRRGPRGSTTELEAMQAAALIRYGRCFKGGVRTAFILNEDWITKLPSDLQAAHRDFEILRDKHIAHSVNDWELNIPVAVLHRDSEKETVEVVNVSVKHHRILTIGDDSIEELRKLADTLMRMIKAQFEEERQRVLNIAKQIPVEELEQRLSAPEARPGTKPLDDPRGR